MFKLHFLRKTLFFINPYEYKETKSYGDTNQPTDQNDINKK